MNLEHGTFQLQLRKKNYDKYREKVREHNYAVPEVLISHCYICYTPKTIFFHNENKFSLGNLLWFTFTYSSKGSGKKLGNMDNDRYGT